MVKLHVAVLFGGKSAEHEISIITALQALEAIDTTLYEAFPVYIHPQGKWYVGQALLDRAFYKNMPARLHEVTEVRLIPDPTLKGLVTSKSAKPLPVDVYLMAFHGQYGEDGCVQGLIELTQTPYTGSNVLASALAMNKQACKAIAQQQGVPTLPGYLVTREQVQKDLPKMIETILTQLQFPLFVKPCQLGSSIGIGVARTVEELGGAIAKALIYDETVLIEPCVTDLMEINVSVLDGEPPQVSVVEVPIASKEVLTYEDKYLRGGSKSSNQGMASLTRLIDPSDLPQSLKQQVQQHALAVFQAVGCSGVCRLDFLYDKAQNALYFNELNSIPGSLSFYLWEKCSPKILYPDLLDRLIQSALKRKARKLSLQQTIDFKAL